MLDSLSIWGMEGIYAVLFILGALSALQYFTSMKIPLWSSIVSTKQASGIAAVALIGFAVIAGGATFAQDLGISGDADEGGAVGDTFSLTDLAKSDHIAKIDGSTYQVQYMVDADDNVDVSGEDSNPLDNVVGTFDLKRVDADAENDEIATLKLVNTQVENSDADASPWYVIEERSDGDFNMAFTPSGGSTEYESTNVLVSPASSKTITWDGVPVKEALRNIEQYSSVSISIDCLYSGSVDDSVTIEFLRTG